MLFEKAIAQAITSELLEVVVLSTDDDEIFTRGRVYPIEVIRRKCGPDGPMVDVLRDALEQVEGVWDAVCTIQPTSPLRTSEDIDAAIKLFRIAPVVSVNEDTGKRNGAVYVCDVACIRGGHVFHDNATDILYGMPAARSLDINVPADLEAARAILGP